MYVNVVVTDNNITGLSAIISVVALASWKLKCKKKYIKSKITGNR